MSNCAEGMEFSLIRMKDLINFMENRISKYEPEKFEEDILLYMKRFMKDKDNDTLVYVEGW